ncbi:MAG TPA: hypothetical protein VG984_00615 [Candidatus Paceibacterota bacterium]|nr:hypothetical protein [Candidatus Paceibacterota bacterium]
MERFEVFLLIVTATTEFQFVALEENCPVEEVLDKSTHVVALAGAFAATVIAPDTVPGATVCASVEKKNESSALAHSGSISAHTI